MPFHALPPEAFLNRETELGYLRRLPALKENALGGNVFLEGARGIGKTELLKQLYRTLFWEDSGIPFYYSFLSANLQGSRFARDFLGSFVRQYIAFVKKEPFTGGGAAESLPRLASAASALNLPWLVEGIENFQEHLHERDPHGQIVAAISLPVAAAEGGEKPVVVMLDDFDAADRLYESRPGDVQGLFSLFGESLRSHLCPHILTGAAGAIETIFTDHALAGLAERMRLGPLPEDLARSLFQTHLDHLGIVSPPREQLGVLGILQGNPLYIRNLAKAVWRTQKRDLTEGDLVECYGLDVSEGETAFYWSSTLGRALPNSARRQAVLRRLMPFQEGRADGTGRMTMAVQGSGAAEAEEWAAAMKTLGNQRTGDPVFRDFIRCLYLREVEGKSAEEVRERIAAQYRSQSSESCFEMVIPMIANAELVVAKAVEQIGKNRAFDAEFLNYLQLALIEVCINAMEHSGSHEKKVYLKFISRPDEIEIVVESSGRHFSLDSRPEISVEEKLKMGMKRGWGFKLVHSIMDKVKIERINDRTRVILIKAIKGKGVSQ